MRKSFARRRVRPRGEWHLWIYCCDWLVYQNGELVGESTTEARAEAAAIELDGQQLVSIDLELDNQQWVFRFDLGGSLETVPYPELSSSGEPFEQWLLYEPTGNVFIARADGAYSHHPGAKRATEETWVPPNEQRVAD